MRKSRYSEEQGRGSGPFLDVVSDLVLTQPVTSSDAGHIGGLARGAHQLAKDLADRRCQ